MSSLAIIGAATADYGQVPHPRDVEFVEVTENNPQPDEAKITPVRFIYEEELYEENFLWWIWRVWRQWRTWRMW